MADKKTNLNDEFLQALSMSQGPTRFNPIEDIASGVMGAASNVSDALGGILENYLGINQPVYPREAQPLHIPASAGPSVSEQERDAERYLKELMAKNESTRLRNEMDRQVGAEAQLYGQLRNLESKSKPGTKSYVARGENVMGLGREPSRGSYTKMTDSGHEMIMDTLGLPPEVRSLMEATQAAKSDEDKYITNQLWGMYNQQQQAKQGKNDAFLAALGSKNEDALTILKALLRARGSSDVDIDRIFGDTTKKQK